MSTAAKLLVLMMSIEKVKKFLRVKVACRAFAYAGMGSALFISHPKVSLFSLLPKVEDNQDRLKKKLVVPNATCSENAILIYLNFLSIPPKQGIAVLIYHFM